MSEPRTHFVYRVYDRRGELLYIGCTGDPSKRWKQHRSERSRWVPYAETFKIVGPYPRQQAFDIERTAIAAERSWFNFRPEYREMQAAYAAERERLWGGSKEVPAPGSSDDVWEDFANRVRAVAELADLRCPNPTTEWREAQYVEAMRLKAVSA